VIKAFVDAPQSVGGPVLHYTPYRATAECSRTHLRKDKRGSSMDDFPPTPVLTPTTTAACQTATSTMNLLALKRKRKIPLDLTTPNCHGVPRSQSREWLSPCPSSTRHDRHRMCVLWPCRISYTPLPSPLIHPRPPFPTHEEAAIKMLRNTKSIGAPRPVSHAGT